jgi:hypothetical protein
MIDAKPEGTPTESGEGQGQIGGWRGAGERRSGDSTRPRLCKRDVIFEKFIASSVLSHPSAFFR